MTVLVGVFDNRLLGEYIFGISKNKNLKKSSHSFYIITNPTIVASTYTIWCAVSYFLVSIIDNG
jgi:hypothetical protein